MIDDISSLSYGTLLAMLRKDLQLDAGTNLQAGTITDLLSHSLTVGRAWRNAALSLGAAGATKIPLDTAAVIDNPNGCFDITTNHRYNVPADGRYQVNGNILVSLQNNPQVLNVYVAKNAGGAIAALGTELTVGGAAGIAFGLSVNDIIQCAAGDFLELWGTNGGGNPCPLFVGNPFTNFLSVVKVG